MTLLGIWAIFFGNYLLIKYCGISSEYVGECVEVAVHGFLPRLNLRVNMSGRGKSLGMRI